MFENSHRTAAGGHDNVSVVSYRRIRHAELAYGLDRTPIDAVAPLQTLRALGYARACFVRSPLSSLVGCWHATPSGGLASNVMHHLAIPSPPQKKKSTNVLFVVVCYFSPPIRPALN